MTGPACLPPPGQREARGYHWLRLASCPPEPVLWLPSPVYVGGGIWRWTDRQPMTPGPADAHGWRYVGPAAPPAEASDG